MNWLPEDLEKIECDFCHSSDFVTRYNRPDGLVVVECENCHVAFVNPRPKPQVVSRLYDQNYFSKGQGSEAPGCGIGYDTYLSGDGYEDMVRQTRIRFAIFSKQFDCRNKRILEVGCATGEFCNLVAEAGGAVRGVDMSNAAIGHARRRFPNIPFQAMAVEELPAENTCDAVVAFEVIEHVISPNAFVEILARQLRPGGMLALSTPNYDCARHVGWTHWDGFRRSFEHLHYFGAKELENLGRAHGLSMGEWFTWGGWASDLPQTKGRMAAKGLLDNLGLINLARRIRDSYKAYSPPYQRKGRQSNLLMLFRKGAKTRLPSC